MSYQKITGPLMANSHPGSYCGQDAYSDMLVTDENILHRKRSVMPTVSTEHGRCAELYARPTSNVNRGGEEPLEEKNTKTLVRRLTPLECERLQGLPDNWTLIGEKGDDGE